MSESNFNYLIEGFVYMSSWAPEFCTILLIDESDNYSLVGWTE